MKNVLPTCHDDFEKFSVISKSVSLLEKVLNLQQNNINLIDYTENVLSQ